jgi:hypothetical protein
MLDGYIRETTQRHKKDHNRFSEIDVQIETLKEEAQKLFARLGAYKRIIKDELGEAAVQDLEKELDAMSLSVDSTTPEVLAKDTLTDSNKLTITDAILTVIKGGGGEGVTPAQVISGVLSLGFSPEKKIRYMES